MSTAKQLPEYLKPPVTEVACSLQFQPLEGLDTAHLGLLWAVYRDRYPKTENHPPLANVRETFGHLTRSQVGISFLEKMPVPRSWFLNPDETRLIQVQQDRFAVNWRRLETGEEYPRYPQLRRTLEEEFDRFVTYLRKENLPAPALDQVELTYVNHIAAGESEVPREDLRRLVSLWAGEPARSVLPRPEDVTIQARFSMPDPNQPQGRLHVSVESRFVTKTGEPIYVLTLTGRGAPGGEGLPGALAFLDLAHEWIVEGFTAITTPEMHKLWERKR